MRREYQVWGPYHSSMMLLEDMSPTDMLSCGILKYTPTATVEIRRTARMMRDSTAQKLVEEGIEELRAAHEKEIEELKEKLKKEVEELKRTHNEHIQALNRQHREEVNREKGWLEEARKTIADLRQGAVNFSNEKEVLEAKRRSLEQKVTDLQSDIGTLRRLHDKQNDQMAVLQTEQAHLLRAMEILLRRVNEK